MESMHAPCQHVHACSSSTAAVRPSVCCAAVHHTALVHCIGAVAIQAAVAFGVATACCSTFLHAHVHCCWLNVLQHCQACAWLSSPAIVPLLQRYLLVVVQLVYRRVGGLQACRDRHVGSVSVQEGRAAAVAACLVCSTFVGVQHGLAATAGAAWALAGGVCALTGHLFLLG